MLTITIVTLFVGLLIFLIYSLIRFVFKTEKVSTESVEIPFRASFDENTNNENHLTNNSNPISLQKDNDVQAYIPEPESNQNSEFQNTEEINQMPVVPGQTPEELKAPEPLQESVSFKADVHSAHDPFEKSDNVAMFGSNLRHPEASMERTKPNFGGLENEIAAGLASQVSKPTEIDNTQFSAEMAQNGGEFMNGIFAFDSTSDGSYFSTL